MAIELVTGVPGAGKTTYAVAVRLAPEVGRQIELEAEAAIQLGLEPGTVLKRRIVQAGIRGLVVEHERLPHPLTRDETSAAEVAKWNQLAKSKEGSDEEFPAHQRLPGQPPVEGVPCILQNWWLWAQPGDLIVCDEVQFVIPRGTLGKRPPYWVQALEIHRHYGVDFLFITQHPQLLDSTIKHLVGAHRHVRSVLGSSLCTVYFWDHASNPERFQMAAKSMFWRRRKHYRLFTSSSAHIAPPVGGRKALLVVPVMLAVLVAGVLHFRSKFFGPAQAQAAQVSVAATAPAGLAGVALPGAQVHVSKRVAGCYAYEGGCRCFDDDGFPVLLAANVCETSSRSFDGAVAWMPLSKRYRPADVSAVAPSASAGAAGVRDPLTLSGSAKFP